MRSGSSNPPASRSIYYPDFALALIWWPACFPTSKLKVVGNTTMDLEKFN
jgi:hypothetical protein